MAQTNQLQPLNTADKILKTVTGAASEWYPELEVRGVGNKSWLWSLKPGSSLGSELWTDCGSAFIVESVGNGLGVEVYTPGTA